jgi:hypothetical protein
LAKFLINLGTALGALAEAAKQANKEFLWILNCHDVSFSEVVVMLGID